MPEEDQRMALSESAVYLVPSVLDELAIDMAKETSVKAETIPASMYDKKTSETVVLERSEHLLADNLVSSTYCRQFPPATHEMEKSSKCKPNTEREAFSPKNSSSLTEPRNFELTSSDETFDPGVCVVDTPVVLVGERASSGLATLSRTALA